MLDRDRIKSELLRRGMTLGTWAKARDIEYSALTRVLYGTAGEEYTRTIRAALKKDGLLFETGAAATKDTTQAVFWTFPAASKYLGVSEKKAAVVGKERHQQLPTGDPGGRLHVVEQ